MQSESISLYFSQGSSDKEYHAELVEKEGGFVVNFRYGRRGAALTTGTKTTAPVPYDKAKKVYDKLIGEKLKKGYSPGESGTAYQATTLEERFTGIIPQLLNAVNEPELYVFFLNHDYIIQEKLDGKRTLLRKQNGAVEGINRRGLVVSLPKAVEAAALALSASAFILDGELVGEVFHAFDILELEGEDLRPSPYLERYSKLTYTVPEGPGVIRLVASAHGTEAKKMLLERVKAARGEGIVIKQITAPYTPGRPASGGSQLKYKLTASATCRVAKRNGSKRSVSLELKGPEGWVGVGNVTIPANFELPAAGNLVEVEYLYAYKGGSLYQPVYRGERDDLSETAATLNQLKYKADASDEDEG